MNFVQRYLYPQRLGLACHRATTANLCAAYPFMAEVGTGTEGVYLGTNLLTAGAGFWFDPFDAYRAGIVTNPNLLVTGEPGMGKSTFVKTLIHRCVASLGRWAAIADPKGEYRCLGDELGMQIIDLHPGGTTRLNPLDIAVGLDDPQEIARQRSIMVCALLCTVLGRDLLAIEDAVVGWATEAITWRNVGPGTPTLVDVAQIIANPTSEMADKAARSPIELARDVDALRFGIGKLLERSLRSMFDGQSTVSPDWSRRGVVIDLSGVHHEPDALAAVMVATTAWLGGVIRRADGPPRLQVLDEAWSLLGNERSARYLQSCLKLGRAFGVANIAVVHRLSDLRAQADDGTATAKIAMGLLADTGTRVLFRQASDQLGDARMLLGLTPKQTDLLGKLARGRAIWKLGNGTAVVEHHVASDEYGFCDTDARMRSVAQSEPADGSAIDVHQPKRVTS